MRTITKNGPGTWSSDSEEVMSAAAECFWEGNSRFRHEWHFIGQHHSYLLNVWWPLPPTYPKGPEAKDDDDKVNSVRQKHEHIHVGHSTVVWVDEVIEELSDRHIYLQSPAKQRPPALASGGAGWEE